MLLTRRQALWNSTFTLGGALLGPQLAKAETAAPKSAIARDPTQKLVTEHFMIDAADPGIKLYVRNKHTEDLKQFSSEKTLLFVHGATQPSEATFDLPLEGLSWMDYVAQHGWDVYLIDVRGYGRSTRPPEMDQPAASNPPIVTTDMAVKDIGSAIDLGCVKTRGRSIAIEQISCSRLFEVRASQAHSISKSNLRISFSSCFGILSFHTASTSSFSGEVCRSSVSWAGRGAL
jgi:hypothetical protein